MIPYPVVATMRTLLVARARYMDQSELKLLKAPPITDDVSLENAHRPRFLDIYCIMIDRIIGIQTSFQWQIYFRAIIKPQEGG